MSEEVDVPYLFYQDGTVGQVQNLFMDNYMTDVYVQRAKRDGLHRALIITFCCSERKIKY